MPFRSTPLPNLALSLSVGLSVGLSGGLTSCGPEAEVLWPTGIVRFRGNGEVGDESGVWTYRYRDGQVREQGRYRNGRRIGTWTQWFPGGQRANEGERAWCPTTQASERKGPWRVWHENGNLRAEGSYQDGRRVGPWTFWKDDGTLDSARSGSYRDGKKIPPGPEADEGR